MQIMPSKPMEHLMHLCVEIGARPIGSPGNHAAADYIREVFQATGMEVCEQRFACPAWEQEQTSLEVNGKKLEAAANAFSLPCDVSASIVAAGTLAELEDAELSDRIAALYGDLTRAPLSAKSWMFKDERDERVVQLLEQKQPAAVLTIAAPKGKAERLIVDWEFTIPSATVSAGAGLMLLQQPDQTVHLHIDTRQSPGHTGNIVGKKAGRRPERIVLCAHYDTTVDSPGACDNGSGVAVMLAVAQALNRRDNRLGLECIAFSGHEYLPLGDDEYLRRCGDQLGQILADINIDGTGLTLGANTITSMTSSVQFKQLVENASRRFPGVLWVEPWPESNHSTFAWWGVPSIAPSSNAASNLSHTTADTVEWISAEKLNEVVSLVLEIVESLQDKPMSWCRE